MNAKTSNKFKEYTHLAWCGPTFPLSKLELAVISASGIAPDSIPKGAMHCAGNSDIGWN